MTPEQKRRGAFEEFDELLSEGMTVPEAIRTAAEDNDMKPEIFRAIAEKHFQDLEKHRGRMMRRAAHDRVVALTTNEIPKCWRREGPYRSAVGGLLSGAEKAIAERVGAALERPLTEPETWTIEDMWDERLYANKPELMATHKRIREQQRSGQLPRPRVE